MLSKTIPGTFEFEVGTWGGDDEWYVHLPHQCDYWEIARHSTRPKAIEELEKFLVEAQAALELLRSGTAEQFESCADEDA
ncbi:hypothetical protein [Nonomuraea sp. NPDC050643]|uniref:hypothetical protein n=1 Tax=Nonomuraea sp. NPDC050643 TaxID=3155660 RepID=UPI0033F23916